MLNEPGDDELVEQAYQLREFMPTMVDLGARRDFKPWHRPSKQFIRLQQWCKQVEKLIGMLNLVDGSVLKYMGLPGEDLLDIRVLEGVCIKHKVRLRYLGFDASLGGVTTNLSLHEVNGKDFIHDGSVVIGDKFEKLSDQNSIARKRIDELGSFDVINLDLCNSVTTAAGEGFPSLEAIAELCKSQVRSPSEPWILFLTTRSLQKEMTPELGERLFGSVLKNLSENDSFRTRLGERLALDEIMISQTAECTAQLADEKWLNAYVLALSKWLLAFMLSTEYKVTVRMLSGYSYGVMQSGHDMASLAFLFEPNPVDRVDGTGLTGRATISGSSVDEAALAVEFVEAISKIENIDNKMSIEKELMDKYIEKTIQLLEPLRYDSVAYRAFVSAPKANPAT